MSKKTSKPRNLTWNDIEEVDYDISHIKGEKVDTERFLEGSD